MIKNFIAIGIGGAIGAMLRYGMTVLGINMHWSSNLSNFLVNLLRAIRHSSSGREMGAGCAIHFGDIACLYTFGFPFSPVFYLQVILESIMLIWPMKVLLQLLLV